MPMHDSRLPCPRAAGWALAACLALLVQLPARAAVAQAALPGAAPASGTATGTPPDAQGPDERPDDPLQRGTPRGALEGFLAAAGDGDYDRAADYLDLGSVPAAERAQRGRELARQLAVVLDRQLWVDLEEVSDEPRGAADDGLPPSRDSVGRVGTSRGEVPILLQRVPRDDGAPIWKFASATLRRVPLLYDEHGPGPIEERLPTWMTRPVLLGLSLYAWCALLGLVLVAAAGSWVAVLLLRWLVRPLAARTSSDVDDRLVDVTAGPLRFAAAIGLFHLGTLFVTLPLLVRSFLGEAEQALLIVAVAWFGVRLVDIFTMVVVRRLTLRGQTGVLGAVPLGQKTLKVVVLLLAAIAMLDAFGLNVTALLAGLGVGGIAVALAAQKSIENFFGGLTLYADRPVSVGDLCAFGSGGFGTVEEIGLRSTRIRTLDRTLVTVPNSEFATMQIENYARRDRIWYHPTIGLRYETSAEQLRYVLVEVRSMLYAHPRVSPDPARIRFRSFGDYALHLEIFAYVETADWDEYLAVAEDLNLRIMDIVEASGTGFAFPSQTLYVAPDERPDAKLAEKAERAVRDWRERGELYLPRFPDERIRALGGTLPWPPEGSPDAR